MSREHTLDWSELAVSCIALQKLQTRLGVFAKLVQVLGLVSIVSVCALAYAGQHSSHVQQVELGCGGALDEGIGIGFVVELLRVLGDEVHPKRVPACIQFVGVRCRSCRWEIVRRLYGGC